MSRPATTLEPRQPPSKDGPVHRMANPQGSIEVTEMPMPVSENLVPANLPAEGANKGITLAMVVAAIVLMTVYFAVSVAAIWR